MKTPNPWTPYRPKVDGCLMSSLCSGPGCVTAYSLGRDAFSGKSVAWTMAETGVLN